MLDCLRDRGIAQFGSAPALGAGGRRFKSCCSDQVCSFVMRSGHFVLRTNNAKKFFEEYSTPLAVGMSDNAGYWAGYFLNKCKIDFVCYVDKNAKDDNSFCNGKPVYSFEKFAEYVSQCAMGGGEQKTFRLFIPSKMLDTVTEDITAIEAKCNVTFVVLNAFYVISKGRLSYNVNKLFGYFRSKLLTTDLPSILANECAARRIYEQLGIGYISPTINTNIKYEDFIKLCRATVPFRIKF